jgi:hypothetical protein
MAGERVRARKRVMKNERVRASARKERGKVG